MLRSLWTEERTTFEGKHCVVRDAICEPKPVRRPSILIGGGGERRLMGIVARHADIWNNLAAFQPELGAKVEALKRRCADVGRDFASIEVSQQCLVVIAETDDAARAGSSARRRYTAATWAPASRSTASGAPRSR